MARAALITKPACMPQLDQFRTANPENPQLPATVIVQVERISRTCRWPANGTLRKPAGAPTLPHGLSHRFWADWKTIRQAHPPGVNVLFTWHNILSAIPRDMPGHA
jgi:alpha-D-ribose 1-methylphosphonate 5-triphosphate synthase subunit PhnH